MSGNLFLGQKQGCLVVNNNAVDSTVNVESYGNRFYNNSAGMVVIGALSSNNMTNILADGNTIEVEAHGDRYEDNTRTIGTDRGGLLILGGEDTSNRARRERQHSQSRAMGFAYAQQRQGGFLRHWRAIRDGASEGAKPEQPGHGRNSGRRQRKLAGPGGNSTKLPVAGPHYGNSANGNSPLREIAGERRRASFRDALFFEDNNLAGGLKFEPRLAESESAVLPLDDPPSSLAKQASGRFADLPHWQNRPTAILRIFLSTPAKRATFALWIPASAWSIADRGGPLRSDGRNDSSYSISARVMPWRIAPAWPVMPPPSTFTESRTDQPSAPRPAAVVRGEVHRPRL